MIRKNFRLNIILRLLITCTLITLGLYYLFIEINYLRSAYIFVFLILSLWELFYYIDRVNRDLATFFTAVSQNDFSTSFNALHRGRSFNHLYASINQLTLKVKDLRAEKEQQLLFLEMLIEHVKAGIIAYDDNEKIVMMNQSLQEMLKRPKLHYLKAISSTDENLFKTLKDIKTGENNLIKIYINNQLLHIAIHASEFHIGNKYYKLISLQDIKTELEANEVETWQKLIRVLTHEIMNSVAPITSLADTLLNITTKKKYEFPATEAENLLTGLEAIKIRSNGLERFTNIYRQLTKIPKPAFQKFSLQSLVKNVVLLQKGLLSKNCELHIKCENDITCLIDPDLISQVLINLIKNAYEAVSDQKNGIIMISIAHNAHTEIKISDNGPGIANEIADQIFVPFFTTKTQGSGIGLSLSRQIMHLHQGSLVMESKPGEGATFIMRL